MKYIIIGLLVIAAVLIIIRGAGGDAPQLAKRVYWQGPVMAGGGGDTMVFVPDTDGIPICTRFYANGHWERRG